MYWGSSHVISIVELCTGNFDIYNFYCTGGTKYFSRTPGTPGQYGVYEWTVELCTGTFDIYKSHIRPCMYSGSDHVCSCFFPHEASWWLHSLLSGSPSDQGCTGLSYILSMLRSSSGDLTGTWGIVNQMGFLHHSLSCRWSLCVDTHPMEPVWLFALTHERIIISFSRPCVTCCVKSTHIRRKPSSVEAFYEAIYI